MMKDEKAKSLDGIFNEIYYISNPLDREHKLIQASHQNENYSLEEFSRLFAAYCQQTVKPSSGLEISKALKCEFNDILRIKDLLDRHSELIKASHRQTSYSSEEYFRLFDTYCQKKIRQRLTRTATGVIGIVSSATIFIGVFTFVRESVGREQQLQASAWQVIASNDKARANDGRKEALEYLNKPSFGWELTHFLQNNKTSSGRRIRDDRANLSGLEASNAFISLVDLKDAKLQEANFQKANLYGANFSGATLSFSNLAQAQLTEAKFIGAKLEKANFSGAVLTDAKVRGACFRRTGLRGTYFGMSNPRLPIDLSGTLFEGAIYDEDTNIQGITTYDEKNPGKLEIKKVMLLIGAGSELSRSDLREADLKNTNLREAHLEGADLEGADLEGANLEGADLKGANLFKVSHLTKEQVLKAKNWKKAIYSGKLKQDLEAAYGVKLPVEFDGVTKVPGCP